MAKSMLRLLSLAACAEVIVSFGTIARTGGDVEIGTESAGLTFCYCAARPTCRLAGYPSLEQPLSGAMSDDTLAGEVTTCWNMCYKEGAPFYESCVEGRDVFLAGICSDFPVANPSYGSGWSYKERLQADATEDNPFKETPGGDAGACGSAQGLDTRSAADRCLPITQNRFGSSIYFTEASCGKAVKEYPFADRAATCPLLYTYFCDKSGTRMATFCEWDAGVCKAATNEATSLKKTSAPECKQLLCTGDDAFDPDNAACKTPAPQCK